MSISVKAAGLALAVSAVGCIVSGAGMAQEGKTFCYAFQYLATGFWVAGHGEPRMWSSAVPRSAGRFTRSATTPTPRARRA
jgi:hypothetical protein